MLIIFLAIFNGSISNYVMRMGGTVPVPARPQRMEVGGRVFSEDGWGRTVTGPILAIDQRKSQKKRFIHLQLQALRSSNEFGIINSKIRSRFA